MGSQGRVSEVLNGKRALSKEMIRRLHAGLGIPAEVLVQEGGSIGAEPGLRAPADGPHHERPGRGYAQGEGTVHRSRTAAERPPEGE